jgi:hypothetical protein
LIAIDLTGRIRKALGAAIPVTGLLEYPTVRQLAALIDSAEADTAETDTAEAGTAETDTAEAGTAEAGTAEAGTAEADTADPAGEDGGDHASA